MIVSKYIGNEMLSSNQQMIVVEGIFHDRTIFTIFISYIFTMEVYIDILCICIDTYVSLSLLLLLLLFDDILGIITPPIVSLSLPMVLPAVDVIIFVLIISLSFGLS